MYDLSLRHGRLQVFVGGLDGFDRVHHLQEAPQFLAGHFPLQRDAFGLALAQLLDHVFEGAV